MYYTQVHAIGTDPSSLHIQLHSVLTMQGHSSVILEIHFGYSDYY